MGQKVIIFMEENIHRSMSCHAVLLYDNACNIAMLDTSRQSHTDSIHLVCCNTCAFLMFVMYTSFSISKYLVKSHKFSIQVNCKLVLSVSILVTVIHNYINK